MDESPHTSSSSESDSEHSSESSFSSDAGEGSGTRKRRCVKRSNYLQGKCRRVYKLDQDLDQSLQE